jgi:putative aldouronate transport system permease protein
MAGVLMAFEKFQPRKGLWGSEFVGFKWFQEFFGSYYFTRLMSNTLLISLKDILVGFPAPIIFALLLNEVRRPRFKKLVQTVSYMPYFVSMVIISSLICSFFSSTGAVTKLFMLFGMPKTNMLGSNQYFQGIFVATNLWQLCGFNSIIYLAAISAIDQELYEAAVIDGANRWKQTLHVTLPCIASTIIMLFIVRLGSVLNVSFEKIILLYSPSTYETGDVISSFVYRKGIQEANYSYSTAVNLFNSVINFAMLLTFNWISRRFTESSLF